ncbi:MAG: hypothetical protein K0R93_393 [Anaerosolibacter sp.]|jgi:hypothetical protein|nr:hypothetical protein [Anaerosolibacter sp.]MDF2545495.1 hypothetical protein [Anaerosolibacter sp.]
MEKKIATKIEIVTQGHPALFLLISWAFGRGNPAPTAFPQS